MLQVVFLFYNLMKKHLILGIAITFLLVSCGKALDGEGAVKYKYIYQNDSGHNLKIIRFFEGLENGNLVTKKDSVFIINNNTYAEENIIKLPLGSTNDSLMIQADSLHLVYDTNRILRLYALNSQNGNYQYSILDLANYQTIASGTNDIKINKYTFTNADYNEAQ